MERSLTQMSAFCTCGTEPPVFLLLAGRAAEDPGEAVWTARLEVPGQPLSCECSPLEAPPPGTKVQVDQTVCLGQTCQGEGKGVLTKPHIGLIKHFS